MTPQSSEYFQQVASDWDAIRSGYFGEAVRQTAIDKAYLLPEMTVADIGSGTGFVAAGLAALVKRVHVVDGSQAMLEIARKNLAGFENVEFHEADGLALPFPDGALDAVFANMYLHHTSEPLAAIREMTRVLRPGGRLVITDMDSHPYEWLKEEMADVWQGFERPQVRDWFKQAGLVNIIVDCSGQSCCAEPVNAASGSQANISIFIATATTRLQMREVVRDNYAAVAQSGSCGCSASDSSGESACCSSGGSGSCCSGSAYEDISITPGYSSQELADAPKEAADISLGCGNPIAMANLRPGEVVLDIGSGGGLDSFLAAARVGPQGRVIGVDMTPAMLERARASAEKNGIRNVQFRQGYAEQLPVEDGEVDVILSNCVINLTEDKGHVFSEAFRALKPGGRLEVSDIVTSGAIPLEMRMSAAGWSECVTGALPEGEYLDLIEQAGFEKPSVRRSANEGQLSAVSVYSVIVSARKPGGTDHAMGRSEIFNSRPQSSKSCC